MRVIDLSTLSLVGGSGIAEAKISLWFASGQNNNFSDTASSTGTSFLKDGTQGYLSSSSATQLFTLSSTWSPSTKFAFECSINTNTTSTTVYFALWDFTSSSVISSSQISTSSVIMSVIRSGQFTLTPSHIYGVTVWTLGSTNPNISDASLIIFP